MNCEQVKELLSAYLDNALAADEGAAVASHLHTCRECNALLAEYRHLDALVTHLPRISPEASLRQKLFTSPEYLELTGTLGRAERHNNEETVYQKRVRRDPSSHPHLVALPGGRPPATSARFNTTPRMRPRRAAGSMRPLTMLVAACLFLVLLLGSFIGWSLLHQQDQATHDPTGITPPAAPQQGPIPAGLRFVFQRDGALWSAPSDGSTDIMRLTPPNTTVAASWVIRPARTGRAAGNMLAYIDLQHGFVHVIRSDGQSDTIINTPLIKPGTQPAAVWDTDLGATLLNSLAWSGDGNTLAFVADPTGSGKPGLYLYATGTGQVQQVPLPVAGSVGHPTWSPDSTRIAFELTHAGKIDILDYNTQNHGLLTIANTASTGNGSGDHVLTLDWSPNINLPIITWSVGTNGHVHSIWAQRVGVEGTREPLILADGNYTQAIYSRNGRGGQGGWLLTGTRQNQPGDLFTVDLNANIIQLTSGRQASFAQWSPDGLRVNYLDIFSSGVGALHVV
ncbi:MAG: PD40 domain-containing protein, partial [Ktedonobacteraceae bacterium]|nr:PD40 domain-containing protein [Ktedonobacteraceae bacterium]